MTCDQVFDLLLESGDTLAEVEEHLRGCPRCRDLQAVLAPLKGVSETTADRRSVPFDPSASVSSESVSAARMMAARLGEAAPLPAAGRTVPARSWKYLAAFLAGMTAALGMAAALRSEPTAAPSGQQEICLWTTRNVQDPKSDDVVLTCVACHLTPSPRR